MRTSLITSALLLGLCACAPRVSLASAGLLEPAAAYTVRLQNDWSYYPPGLNVATRGSIITKDGPVLNRVHMLTVEPGQSIVKVSKKADAPRYQTGNSQLDNLEFVEASFLKMGYQRVEIANVRAVTLDNADGVRLDMTGQLDNGLNVKGDIVFAKYGDALHVLFFVAPTQHYYAQDKDEVDAIINSLKFLPKGA